MGDDDTTVQSDAPGRRRRRFIFRYRFTFGTENENSTNGVADDIGVTGPTVTCSLT